MHYKRFNFQPNRISDTKRWETIPFISVWWPDWSTATKYAIRLAHQYKAAVRITEGHPPKLSPAKTIRITFKKKTT